MIVSDVFMDSGSETNPMNNIKPPLPYMMSIVTPVKSCIFILYGGNLICPLYNMYILDRPVPRAVVEPPINKVDEFLQKPLKTLPPLSSKKQTKKEIQADSNLRLSQMTRELTGENDRQRKISNLPAEKLELLQDKRKQLEMVIFSFDIYIFFHLHFYFLFFRHTKLIAKRLLPL